MNIRTGTWALGTLTLVGGLAAVLLVGGPAIAAATYHDSAFGISATGVSDQREARGEQHRRTATVCLRGGVLV